MVVICRMDFMWILIAQSSHARVYVYDRKIKSLNLVREFHHPRGRIKPSSYYSDKSGRSMDGMQPRRHAFTSTVEPRDQEVTKFAHKLVQFLHKEHGHNSFYSLILVAPPPFLGALRLALTPTLEKSVSREITKDFADWMPDDEMRKRLLELVVEPALV